MIDLLRKYETDGLLYSQTHPTLPLIIWNYAPKVQYEGLWDDVTIMSRGLVTNTEGKVISKTFSKFWNIEECKHTPTNDFEILEKLDGQYIGVFWYDGQMVVNSRGSFTSPYAIEARRILDEKYPDFEKTTKFNKFAVTSYCFELIGFEQIVVSYPEPDLVMTGIFSESHYGGWIDHDVHIIGRRPFGDWPPLVKKHSGLDYTQIKQLNWKNAEGFVVRFSNGDRCKIKFEDYVRLHRQMTNLSTTGIWEALKDGNPVSSILTDVPDEFFAEVNKIEKSLIDQYKAIEFVCDDYIDRTKLLPQKEFAECVFDSSFSAILFSMRSGKDYSQLIWKLIRPEFKKI